jgi:integrase
MNSRVVIKDQQREEQAQHQNQNQIQKQKQYQRQTHHIYPEFDQRSELERIIREVKERGLSMVLDFLVTKARGSPRTARIYSHGINHLSDFISQQYGSKYDIETIIQAIKKGEVDAYVLLNGFINYLQVVKTDLMPRTIQLYQSAIKSYLAFHDIELSANKYRARVSLPSICREDEQPIDAADIRQILSHCNNRRLKAYLFVLASGGMRAMEALGMREIDLDFSGIDFNDPADVSEPAGVYIRKEFSKTKQARNIFISNEAARYLNEWLVWKYRNLKDPIAARKQGKEDLIFARGTPTKRYPIGLYDKIASEFRAVLQAAGFTSRKSEGVFKRYTVSLHSFRRFVKTTISDQTGNSDYSEWFLGHRKSTYYTNKPEERKRIYKDNCMKYLTFLDYPTVEATGRSFEAMLKSVVQQKDEEIAQLKLKIEQLSQGTDQIKELTQKAKEYDSFMARYNPMIEEFQREINSLKLRINSETIEKKRSKNKN